MPDAIKKQAVARIMTLLVPLKAAGTLRTLERKTDIFQMEDLLPAAHLVIGQEDVVGEDTQGYTMQFPAAIKLMAQSERDLFTVLDDLVPAIQTAIENDMQLNALVNKISYSGDQPFIAEVNKPVGGTILLYEVVYRRKRSLPAENY